MQRLIYILIVLFNLPLLSFADSYPEVIFDNSLVGGSYAKSSVNYTGDSWVENVNRRLLVSDTLFFTPGNALSLKYISAANGNWRARINYNRQKNYYRFNPSDQLSFFLYINSKNTKVKDLPRLVLQQRDGIGDTISIEKYIPTYVTNQWIQVKIPCTVFTKINKDNTISGIGFVQNKSSDGVHHLFLDQIEFLPSKYSEAKLSSPSILTDAIPYDKMVHLKWQLPLSPSIRYVKLYRSTDGKSFQQVAMRPVHMQSCLDVVPKTGQKYYYKIAWVDYNYKESPMSAVKEAETRSLSDSSIIELVQGAHINYFVENFDINSGMYMPYRVKDKAIVSTKETAGAILALLVGAEKGQVSKSIVLQRISKIAYFLMRAQNRYGIYPAYFDGRKGVPEYRRGAASYDVQATASLIEALLIAREYFSGDQEIEKDLRNRITALYDQIDWMAIANDKSLLKAKFALVDSDVSKTTMLPISGANEAINTYLLAISARKNPLPVNSYFDAVYNKYGMQSVEQIEELNADIYTDSLSLEDSPFNIVNISYADTLAKKTIMNPIQKYGVALPFGELSGSLMELYKPFLTINPALIQDSVVNWTEVLNGYINYVKRRDNEFGVGASSGDIWGFYQHRDSVGNYRINPAIGPSAMISNKEIGKAALLALFNQYGNLLFTEYGFKSWLDLRNSDESDEYLAMNQSAIAVILENAKTGFIWKLYEQIPELKVGREKLFAKPPLLVN